MSLAQPVARSAPLAPANEAQQLAEHMARADGVMRAVLEETIESAERGSLRESGRTACGSVNDLRRPHKRFPMAVELEECPITTEAGIWHTHVTREELRSPRHSIPDWANVVFGDVAASIVVGTRELEVITAAADQGAMTRAFQDALGVDVTSQRGVIAALRTGKIASYERALADVQAAMAPLVSRRSVAFRDLDERVDVVPTIAERLGGRRGLASGHGHPRTLAHGYACRQVRGTFSPDVGRMRERSRAAADTFAALGREIGQRSIDEALGITVAFLVRDFLMSRF